MNNVFRNFYRNFYMRTGGYMPAAPLNQSFFPGDFFQIRNGEMVVLGNIFRDRVVDPLDAKFSYGIRLNPAGWNFSDGVTKPYSGRGSGHGSIHGDFQFSKQVLSFADYGSFIFKGNEPEAVKLVNFNELQQALIIRLTTVMFSFRELYLVTESATAESWTLAIASSGKGELEISTDSENFGLVDIFGHGSTKTIQSKDIEYDQRETKRKPVFFKAKKLVVQDDKLEVFISQLIKQTQGVNEWAGSFYDYGFHYDTMYSTHARQNISYSLPDMLQAGELNPNTALLYFTWEDANMDDIEKLFLVYGT